MPDLKLQLGTTAIDLNATGDLVNNLQPGTAGLVQLAARLAPLATKTLAEVDETALVSGFNLDQEGRWIPGGSTITLSVKPAVGGTITIKKSGEVFSYAPGDDPTNRVSVTVPAGRVYIGIILNAGLSVAGSGAFSSGNFGVSGNISSSDTFSIANYKSFPEATPLAQALADSFSGFRLPFSATSVAELDDGDYLDFSFIGTLALGLGATWGISGSVLGGRSAGEIKASLENNLLGSVAFSAKPVFQADAGFSVKYAQNDAFRVVVGRTKTADVNGASLYLFRADKKNLTTAFNATLNLAADANFNLTSNVDSLLKKASDAIESRLPSPLQGIVAPSLATALQKADSKLDGFVADANKKVGALLSEIDAGGQGRKVALQVMQERQSLDTALFQYTFDLNADPTLAGLKAALDGDYVTAVGSPGVTLAPGAFVEHQFLSRTSLGFQFFGLWRWTDVSQYFENVTTTYVGNGVFRLVAKIGASEESGPVGRTGLCQVYFTAGASETAKTKTFADLDVKLVFESVDTRNPKSAGKTLEALDQLGDATLSADTAMVRATDLSTKTLSVSCTVPSQLFGSLQFDPPGPLPHVKDGANYNKFVNAVVALNPEAPQAPISFVPFRNWVVYNQATNFEEGSTTPPDRRLFGAGWPNAFIMVPNGLARTKLGFYFDQSQAFMNLCEDLYLLTGIIDQATTEAGVAKLLATLERIIKTDFGLFIQPAMIALIQTMHAKLAGVQLSGVDTDKISLAIQTALPD